MALKNPIYGKYNIIFYTACGTSEAGDTISIAESGDDNIATANAYMYKSLKKETISINDPVETEELDDGAEVPSERKFELEASFGDFSEDLIAKIEAATIKGVAVEFPAAGKAMLIDAAFSAAASSMSVYIDMKDLKSSFNVSIGSSVQSSSGVTLERVWKMADVTTDHVYSDFESVFAESAT